MGASPEESADGLWTHESFVYNTDKMEEFRVWGPGPSKARFFMERPLMDVLQMLLRREGTTLAEDPRRLGNLLRDWCPGQRREIGLVTVVAEEGLPALLRSETMPPTTRRSLALRRLREERGLDAAAAARGVDLWIGALGEASQASEGRAEFPEEVEDPPPAKSSLEERARNLDREAWQRACHAPLFSGNTPEEAMDRAWGALFSSESPGGSPEEVAPLLEEAALLGNREALHWLAELQDVTGYAPRDAGAVCEERTAGRNGMPMKPFAWDGRCSTGLAPLRLPKGGGCCVARRSRAIRALGESWGCVWNRVSEEHATSAKPQKPTAGAPKGEIQRRPTPWGSCTGRDWGSSGTTGKEPGGSFRPPKRDGLKPDQLWGPSTPPERESPGIFPGPPRPTGRPSTFPC